jgi:hypothetical protein
VANIKTGIGKTKRDLRAKIGKLAKVVKAKKGEFSSKDKDVFKKALVNMTLAYKLLEKIPCIQPEMSVPFGYYGGPGTRRAKARRTR